MWWRALVALAAAEASSSLDGVEVAGRGGAPLCGGDCGLCFLDKVDETAKTCRVVWDYVFGDGYAYDVGYAEVFGDHDLMPTANHMTNWWSANKSGVDGIRSQILELTPNKEKALEIDLRDNDTLISYMTINWKIYSSERIYDRPLLWDATCEDDVNDAENVAIAAKTVNTYKESHMREGTLELLDAAGSIVATRAMAWDPFWSPTTVTAALNTTAAGAAKFRVVNQHGQRSRAIPLPC